MKPETKITEAQFTTQVIQLAQLHRWRVAHFRPARTAKGWRTPVQGDGMGFPDLILIRGGECMAVELKRDGGRLRDKQTDWLLAFLGAGIQTRVWTPSDWPEIERRLMAPVTTKW